MSTKYLATFAVGFEELVKRNLQADILCVFDGAIIFKAPISLNLPFVKNIFIILDANKEKIKVPPHTRTFKLSIFNENIPAPISGKLITKFENKTNLKYRSAGGDVNFWIWKRRDGTELFLQKISG